MSKNKKPLKQNVQQPAVKTVTNKTNVQKPASTGSFQWISYLENKPAVGYALLGALLLVLMFIVFGKFISFRYYYLFKDIGSDSVTIFYPTWVHYSEYIRQFGYPVWSFQVGMGQSVYGNLFNPFSSIVFFPKEMIAGAVVFYELAKIAVVAFLSYTYFKSIKYSSFVAIPGALFISFSGYMIIGSGWYGPTNEVLYLMLFMVAFEQIFQRNSWWLFLLGIFFYAIFNLAFIAIFIALYAFFRLLEENLHPLQLRFWAAPLKMAGLGTLGFMLVAVFFIPNVLALYNSPRLGGDAGYFTSLASVGVFQLMPAEKYITQLYRFYSNDILGNGIFCKDIVGNWENYFEAPGSYIGLFSLLLFPQLFTLIGKREKWLYGGFLALWLLPVVFPYLRYAFWLFSGDYYRLFSFISSLVMLLIAMKAFHLIYEGKKIHIPLLLGTAVLLIVLLYIPYAPNAGKHINQNLRMMSTFVLIGYTAILFWFQKARNKGTTFALIVALALIELGVNAYSTTNHRYLPDPVTGQPTSIFAGLRKSDLTGPNGYYNTSYSAIQYIQSIDSSFYRINKEFNSQIAIHGGLNDAMVQGFNGTPSYSSFNQLYYINFLKETGVIRSGIEFENETRWSPGLSGRPLLQSLASVKYDISVADQPFFLSAGYTQIHQIENVKILKNQYAMPLGFTYSQYIPLSDFRKLSTLQKDIALLRAFVADSVYLNPDSLKGQFEQISLADTIAQFSFEAYRQFTDSLRKDSLHIVSFNPNKIKGTIQLNRTKMLFLSIPYDQGWSAKVNGINTPLKLTNIGFMGIILPPGNHEIELTYTPAYLAESKMLSLAGLFILLLLIGGEIFMFYKNKRKSKPTTVELTENTGV